MVSPYAFPDISKSKFSLGDIVKLKSGGPNMTIQKMRIQQCVSVAVWYYRCIWMDCNNNLQEFEFHEKTLEKP